MSGRFDDNLDHTIDTNISMPEEDARTRANRYESDAADQITEFDLNQEDANLGATPPPKFGRPEIRVPRSSYGGTPGQSTPGSVGSPFNQMTDDNSLALSESHEDPAETFEDLDGSSRSIEYNGQIYRK